MKLKYDTSTLNGKIAVMQEYERTGKRPMCRGGLDKNFRPLNTSPFWQWNDLDYNYPAEPKLVQWTFETTPRGVVLLQCEDVAGFYLVTNWSLDGLSITHRHFPWKQLMECCKHSVDNGKTWQPCVTYEP